jgi:type II secretory pathway pseudopilin PulG
LPARRFRQNEAGFTLVEALAAVAFLAILVPVAVDGLRVANLAGQVAERKIQAARIADRLLHTQIATGQWQQAANSGTVVEEEREFRWQLRAATWNKDALRQLTLTVTYVVQGKDYSVQVSTLADSTATTL